MFSQSVAITGLRDASASKNFIANLVLVQPVFCIRNSNFGHEFPAQIQSEKNCCIVGAGATGLS